MTSVAISNPRLDAALSYAALGWRVFPVWHVRDSKGVPCACGQGVCTSIGKHPRTPNGVDDATTDEAVIAEWWRVWPKSNVGVAMGAESGVVAIDIDPRHNGDITLASLLDEHGDLPETIEAVTGSGGAHLIFAHPGGKVGNDSRGDKLGRGIDVRGDGGYIVAAPSNHMSGGVYGWKTGYGPEDAVPAKLPAWLAETLIERESEAVPIEMKPAQADAGTAKFWLSKALVSTSDGNRNAMAFWLACQLRDAGIPLIEAEPVALDYAASVPAGEHPFTPDECVKTFRSAYVKPPRGPAVGELTRSAQRITVGLKSLIPAEPVAKMKPSNGAAAELSAFLDDVVAGKIYNVPFPWRVMTNLTQALLPSSIMSLCGDPGVGKTFFILQALQFWHANDFKPAVFFIEKNRLFHTRRLLAQLEGNGKFVDLDWVKHNPAVVAAAMKRHADLIDELGQHIYSRAGGRITLQDLLEWAQARCEAGSRVLVIDPITAAHAGADRWVADDDFVIGVQQVIERAGASLVVVTHPKKGSMKPGQTTAHDQAGGAAYNRFVDSVVWLSRPRKKRHVRVKVKFAKEDAGTIDITPDIFAQLFKTRDGMGNNLEIAMRFEGNALQFKEEGIVERDLPAPDEDE